MKILLAIGGTRFSRTTFSEIPAAQLIWAQERAAYMCPCSWRSRQGSGKTNALITNPGSILAAGGLFLVRGAFCCAPQGG